MYRNASSYPQGMIDRSPYLGSASFNYFHDTISHSNLSAQTYGEYACGCSFLHTSDQRRHRTYDQLESMSNMYHGLQWINLVRPNDAYMRQ